MGHEAEANEKRRRQAVLDAAAVARLFDRFGRPIVLGGEYEFHDPLPPIYIVLEATPDLRREARPGTWILTLQANLQISVTAGQRHGRLTLVQMPAMNPPIEDATEKPDPASDAPAAPAGGAAGSPGGIVLTDMDRTARETLAEAEPASSEAQPPEAPPSALTLVPPAERGSPADEDLPAEVPPSTTRLNGEGD